ncbi:MAG: Alr0786 protein [uncultured Caballeronia sp.]|nr:MAG: Alr0786 protein [uncultured Caballeronia sp.]
MSDVSCLVIPEGCVGLPVFAALAQRIPVIAVRENRNVMRNNLPSLPWAPGQLRVVDNYWEAAGVIAAMRVGLNPNSVRRPLKPVDVLRASTSPARCATPITATANVA